MSKAEESRPTKRRRTEMPRPEGFISNAPPKPAYRPPEPQFQSAFEDDSKAMEPDEHSTRRSVLDPLAMKRPLRRSGEKNRVPLCPSFHGGLETVKQHKELGPPPRPPLIGPTSHQGASRKEPRIEEKPKSFRVVAPPPHPVVASSSRAVTTPLQPIVPPSFPNPNFKSSSKHLQPIQPPVIPPAPPKASITDLRAISGAGFGLLNDLSTEELAGILLRDQRPEIYAHESSLDNSVHRGLGVSPEKKGKGNNSKFLRGGLAMRASSLFNHSTTSLILWQKEVAHRSNALRPDICASVIKILHKPFPSLKGTVYLPGIALCRIRALGGASHPTYKNDHLYRIVFSFNSSSSSLEHFSVGQTIRVFKPWQEISFKENGEDVDSNGPRLPASLPMPLSIPLLTPDPLDAPLDDTALFCSRFLLS